MAGSRQDNDVTTSVFTLLTNEDLQEKELMSEVITFLLSPAFKDMEYSEIEAKIKIIREEHATNVRHLKHLAEVGSNLSINVDEQKNSQPGPVTIAIENQHERERKNIESLRKTKVIGTVSQNADALFNVTPTPNPSKKERVQNFAGVLGKGKGK